MRLLLKFLSASLGWVSIILSSSYHAANTNVLYPLPPPISIVHRFREVLKTTSCIGTELLYISSCWSSCLYSSMWMGPLEYIAYEFDLTFPAGSHISGSSNLDSFHDGCRRPYSGCFVVCCFQDLIKFSFILRKLNNVIIKWIPERNCKFSYKKNKMKDTWDDTK